MKKPDPCFDRAERDYLTPPEERRAPARCPACGSIDINAFGNCTHCGQKATE